MKQLRYDLDERPHTVLAVAAVDAATRTVIELVHSPAFGDVFNLSLASDFVMHFREQCRVKVADLTQVEVATNYPPVSRR